MEAKVSSKFKHKKREIRSGVEGEGAASAEPERPRVADAEEGGGDQVIERGVD
jgi:hypothetical protein